MTTSTIDPQPGAQVNPMLPLSMVYRDVSKAGWPTLTKEQAQNFIANAEAVVLKKGQTLYRVYGGCAKMSGGYWSPEPPAPTMTEAEWRRSNAIEFSWNTGEFVASFTAEEDIHVWTGGVEAQPAQDVNTAQVIPDYWLKGGGTQFFVAFWTIDGFAPKACGKTPWTSASSSNAPPLEDLIATPGDFPATDQKAAFAFQMGEFAGALHAAAEAIAKTPTGTAADEQNLECASANLVFAANTILRNIGHDAKKVDTTIRAQVGLKRHIQIDAHTPNYEDLEKQLNAVIAKAVELSGRG